MNRFLSLLYLVNKGPNICPELFYKKNKRNKKWILIVIFSSMLVTFFCFFSFFLTFFKHVRLFFFNYFFLENACDKKSWITSPLERLGYVLIFIFLYFILFFFRNMHYLFEKWSQGWQNQRFIQLYQIFFSLFGRLLRPNELFISLLNSITWKRQTPSFKK